ncbi:MAG: [protein-PII] uridylyltransferase, partial [Desulfobulbaceae bacterium]|nr:[protein-PII] uridylyltransferase [Desulfobulbaceae bacterium]
RASSSIQELSEAILYPLWDSGFDVGHSVRSVKDAIRFAREDFIFQVALLDARMLTGSSELFEKLTTRYKKKILKGRRNEFVRTMLTYMEERREKYGQHSFLLEPHIKESKGGMRDIQAILWVAKAVFGLTGIPAIEDAGMISANARENFLTSWNMLARIRNRLHYLSRRKNDQLVFEYQEEMASAFGFEDNGGQLAVERFMREVYGHLQTIAVVTDLFFEHVEEVIGLAGKDRGERQLEKSIVLHSGTVRLVDTAALREKPYLLLRLFLQAGRENKPVHHRTRLLVTAHLHLVDDGFRSSRRAAKIFLELLTKSKEPLAVLESMLETGFLTEYLPEYQRIESLAQHDMYHVYTVDRHQLQAVAEVAKLKSEEPELFMSLASPHLLYLAALLHDIGKGHRTDHSVLGEKMVRAAGHRLGLPKDECDCLAFLVRYHLYIPENAMRRDLEDQDFIQQAAELISDVDRLTMLYLLSVADSRATGPSAWSDWKGSLLAEFFLRVKSCLAAACESPENKPEEERPDSQGVAWLRDQIKALLPAGIDAIRLAHLPDDYIVSFTPEMVVRHLQLHSEQATRLQQQVVLFPEPRQGYWSLLVISRDRAGLLAKLFGVLALHNLSVLAAQIFTWNDGTAVDVLDVMPPAAGEFTEHDWESLERDLNLAVNYRLDVGLQLHNKLHSYGFKPKKPVQQLNEKVVIDNESSARFTLIEVHAGERLGALYQLTQTLTDFGLDIHRAKIATEVEQLIDVFYVTMRGGEKLEDLQFMDKVRETLAVIAAHDEAIAA